MVENNKMFDKVYSKLVNTILIKIKEIIALKEYGISINYDMIKKLNLFISYLDRVKASKYKYNHVDNLTGILTYLNKI